MGQRLFRPVRRENGRLVLVRGPLLGGQEPAAQNPSKSVNIHRCPRCQDLENQTTQVQLEHRTCVRTCTTISVILFIVILPFFVFAIVGLFAFFYREDLTSSEKWQYLTG